MEVEEEGAGPGAGPLPPTWDCFLSAPLLPGRRGDQAQRALGHASAAGALVAALGLAAAELEARMAPRYVAELLRLRQLGHTGEEPQLGSLGSGMGGTPNVVPGMGGRDQ